MQLTSGTAWLEHLGFVHGDLRPANSLVDAKENLHVADFDAVVRPGEELVVTRGVFCKMNAVFEPPPASAATDQFSLGSCTYSIRFGHWPWHDLEPREGGLRMIPEKFPPVSTDPLFGEVIKKCWKSEYVSVSAVEGAVRSKSGVVDDCEAQAAPRETLDALRLECLKYVGRQNQEAKSLEVLRGRLISETWPSWKVDTG